MCKDITRENNIYGFNYDDMEHRYTKDRLTFLSLELKMLQKRHFYNIKDDFSSFGVILKNENYDENLIGIAPKALNAFFNAPFTNTYDTSEFSIKFGDIIIKKTLAGCNEKIEDFEFKMLGSKFIFSFVESEKHSMFIFFPKDNKANDIISKKYAQSYKENGLKFIDRVDFEFYQKYIKNGCDINILTSLSENMLKKCIEEYNANTSYSKVRCVNYDGVRLEANYISAVLKIVEYLGHGSYMLDMSEADKISVSKYIANEYKTKKYELLIPLRLTGKSVFYSGKGTEKNDEKLIILT